jgi:hypothetical protein
MGDAQAIVAKALTEKQLQKQVRGFAEDMGWRVAVTWTSLHSPRGWPDLFMVRGKEFCAIELKTELGKVSDYQAGWLRALAALPGARFVGVIRPSDWYKGKLDKVIR